MQKHVRKLKSGGATVKDTDCAARTAERCQLISLVYRPFSRTPGLTAEDLEAILVRFPALRDIYECTNRSRDILSFGTPEQLAEWVEQAASSSFPKIVSTAEGVRRDLEAAMNAVLYSYSNGVVEGSNTKIKLAKRVMFGRCDFSTLRTKILLREQRKLRTA